jgi:glycosyltransferase involved in cell wall biosynthesis
MKYDDFTTLVSIIIPVYNRRYLLGRTLKSVVNQTYRNIEVLVVDDSSSEDIKSVTDSFNDPRIRYFKHNRNKGVVAARNTGLKEAKGQFISFLDSDDEYLPEKTEKQVKVFFQQKTGDNIEIVYCRMLVEKQNVYRLYYPKVCRWNILLQQIMVKKQVIEKTGPIDENFIYADDIEYIYRLHKNCRLVCLNQALVILHSTPGSMTKHLESLNKYTELFVRKHWDTLLPKEKSKWLYYIGVRYLHIGDIQKGYRSFLRAFIAYSLNQRAL